MSELPSDLMDNTFWCSLIALRREMHMHPETGFKEVRTQSRVREVLTKFAGIPEDKIRASAITGLIADIHGTGPAKEDHPVKCIALRTDLDALCMTEGNSSLPYRSKNEGVAHMCGHDGHIAGLVGVAILLNRCAHKIPSNFIVRLLCQPAEESTPPGTAGFDFERTGGGGAMPMIDDGCLNGVDEVYGWHNWPSFLMGACHIQPGPVMAHGTKFEIEIQGRGGHGSQPHNCVDPIVCGAAVVNGLQTIVSRSLPSWSNAVVTIAQFHAGERHNVIPDTAKLSGTIRDVDEKVFATIKSRFAEIVNSICKAYGCIAEVDIQSMYPAVMTHEAQFEVVKRCAAKLEGPLSMKISNEGLPIMAAEDFSYYLKERPGAFMLMGTKEFTLQGLAAYSGSEETMRSNCVCHGTTYDFNDNVLPRVLMMLLCIVEDRFGLDLYSQEEVLKASFELTPSEEKRGEKRPRTS